MEKIKFRYLAGDGKIFITKHGQNTSLLKKYLFAFNLMLFLTVTTLLYKSQDLSRYSIAYKVHIETDIRDLANKKLSELTINISATDKATNVKKEIYHISKTRKVTTNSNSVVRATTEIKKKKKVLLVVGVLTKLSVVARRNTIRATWFQQCKQNPGIAQCRFFTDQLTNSTEKIYQRENNENGQDMLFMPIKGGYSFAQRLVWMMQWFTENYEFDFFLRVDDDYFLCMNRLLLELPHRPKTGLFWGWVHCFNNIVRVDEGWMILTKDIIEEALSKYNTTLLCHPFGGQAVPLWIRDSKLPITWFADNDRLIHQATTYTASKFMVKDLCEKYLGLHGTYKEQMINYWTVSESKVIRFHENNNNGNRDSKQPNYYIPTIPNFHHVCKADMNFKNTAFSDGFRFKPKFCKDNPKWSISDTTHNGRENSR